MAKEYFIPVDEVDINPENGWNWEWFLWTVHDISGRQNQFELERTESGPGSPSMFDYNTSEHLLARGVFSEAGESLEEIIRQRWKEAETEVVDQLIFVSSLFNHLDMSDVEVHERFERLSMKVMENKNGDGSVARLRESSRYWHEFAEQYAHKVDADGVEKDDFSIGEINQVTVVEIQTLIAYEAGKAIAELFRLIGGKLSTDEIEVRMESVKNRSIAILIHLGYLFQTMNLSITDMRELALAKIIRNEERYDTGFFGKGLSIAEAIKLAKQADLVKLGQLAKA